MRALGMILMAACLVAAGEASAADIERRPFGTLTDGTLVEAITLSAGSVSATVITFGASLQALRVPDRAGKVEDIVLGYDDLAGYLAKSNYFGSTVGRVANRIARGTYQMEGKVYRAPLNDGPNSLHGGDKGFDKAVWKVIAVEKGAVSRLTLAYTSPDGDQGYPGRLEATATYTLDAKGELSITLGATTDRPTIVNMTNHAYWNLAGEGSPRGAMGMKLTMPAAEYTPVDDTLIPTGEFRSVAGTAFDFRKAIAINDRLRGGNDAQLRYGRGYDHNMVSSRTRPASLQLMARMEDPVSGRVMELLSDQPGLQFYSGNFLDGTITGKGGHIYRAGDAVALEPQMFPDTANKPAFGSLRLNPGEHYENRMVFRFFVNP